MSQAFFFHLRSLMDRGHRARRSARTRSLRSVPILDALEARQVLSTASSITANFTAPAIAAGDTVWFSGAMKIGALPAPPPGTTAAPVTIHVVNAEVDFTANGTSYSVPVPNADIVLTPGATTSSVAYDPTDNDYDVAAPAAGAGDVFMGGVALPVPAGLPGGIKSVTYSASFWSDTANVNVSWTWSAAAYTSFSTDYNALGIKPVDAANMSAYANADQSGSPEAFKPYVVSGATGGGGKNYTGNPSPGANVKPTLGDGASLYPFVSSNPLTSVAFNESTVLKGSGFNAATGTFDVWYSDEHALSLGVNQVVVKSSSGSATTNYAVAPLLTSPGVAINPAIGTTATTGNQAGTDVSGRPMAPTLYITNITNNPKDQSGDWQYGGTGYAPSAVYGSWKSFTRTVDTTTSPATVSVTASADPAKNDWNLGQGADPVPSGLQDEGYGAEIQWSLAGLASQGVNLIPGDTYRFYVIVHDGDQNKVGGDAGQATYTVTVPGMPAPSISGQVFVDANSDNLYDSGDIPLSGIVVVLTGTDNMGNAVSLSTTTDANGDYSFTGLAPGTYQIARPAVSGYTDKQSLVGTDNGLQNGVLQTDNSIAQIVLAAGDQAINYDFTEGPTLRG